MLQNDEVAKPENGKTDSAILSQNQPAPTDQTLPGARFEQNLLELGILIKESAKQSGEIRRKLRELLDDDELKAQDVKDTKLLTKINLTDAQRKSAYRWLRAEIVSKNIGLPAGELCEFFARKLAKLKTAEAQKKAYILAEEMAWGHILTSEVVEEAISKVIAAEPSVSVETGKTTGSSGNNSGTARNALPPAVKFSKHITKSMCNASEISLIRELCLGREEFLRICHSITSKNISSSDLKELVILIS